MKRSDTRILTTHVGSLIRPAELLELGKSSRDNAQAERRYRDALGRATEDVVRRQVDAGVDIVNDGEYGKSSWANYVLERASPTPKVAKHHSALPCTWGIAAG